VRSGGRCSRTVVDVSPDDLDAHARRVDAIAGALQEARDLGAAARLDPGCYGVLCAAVPALLASLQDKILEGTADAADSLRDGATRLHAAAGGYRGLEPE
jgi:hypothetical protein